MKSPTKAYDVLDTVTQNLSVDSGWSTPDMRDLANSMRNVGSSDIDFLTVPVKGTGMVGEQSVVFLDKGAGAELWGAVLEDRVGDWVKANPDTELPSSVR